MNLIYQVRTTSHCKRTNISLIPKCWLTDSLQWFEDDVTAVEHQQACEDEYYDPESETGLKGQRQQWLFSFQFLSCQQEFMCTHPQSSQKTSNFRHFRLCSKHSQTHNVGEIKQITCLMPQGMLSIDVPIIVFHIAKLWGGRKQINN